MVGNLESKWDIIDIRDVVRNYILLVQYGVARETYNVGSRRAVAIKNIADIIIVQSSV